MSHPALPAPNPPVAPRAVPIGFAYAVVAIVGVTVLTVSAYYLWRLALLVHMPVQLAWTLPVALDAGAAGATVCWVGATGGARVWGRGIAISALAATVVGNALSHLIGFGLVTATPVLVIGIGAVYPALLWAMVHLALTLRAERSQLAAEPVIDASLTGREPSPVSDSAADASPGPALMHRGTPEDRRHWIAARLDGGHAVTGADVERRFGTRNGARELAQVMARRRQMAKAA